MATLIQTEIRGRKFPPAVAVARHDRGHEPAFVRATSAAGRLLLVLAAVLAAVAVVAFSSGLRTQPERRSRVLTRPADVVVGQDAAGCPNRR